MKLLLDTHALLWWLSGDKRLGSKARELIAASDTQVLVSMVSFWEIVVKVRKGKLDANTEDVWEAVLTAGFDVLGVNIEHVLALFGLPMLHRDPFDHLLLAQAKVEGAVFISEDGRVPGYEVSSMTCSDSAADIR